METNPKVKRYLMSQYQLKNLLVDVNHDHLLNNFITSERQEISITLSDFIRIVHDEIPKITETDKPKIERAITVNGYPIVLYTGIVNYLGDIVKVLDLTRDLISDITGGKYMDISQVHDIINEDNPTLVRGVINRFGFTISMMYECFLINTIIMNIRAMRVPMLAEPTVGYMFRDMIIQPPKLIPKVGPELACLLNMKKYDFNSYELTRSTLESQNRELFGTLTGDVSKLRSLHTKTSKVFLNHLLSTKGITPEDIRSAESFYISHISKITDDSDSINEMSDYISSLSKFTRVLRFLEADTKSFNEKTLRYLVDFE